MIDKIRKKNIKLQGTIASQKKSLSIINQLLKTKFNYPIILKDPYKTGLFLFKNDTLFLILNFVLGLQYPMNMFYTAGLLSSLN